MFRQESKQRTDQRRGAEEFPFVTLTISRVITSEINRPLLWTPLPASPCRIPVLVACRKLVLLYLVPTPTPVGNMIQVHLVAYFTFCVSIVGFFLIATLCRIIFPHAVGMVDCFCFVRFYRTSLRLRHLPLHKGGSKSKIPTFENRILSCRRKLPIPP